MAVAKKASTINKRGTSVVKPTFAVKKRIKHDHSPVVAIGASAGGLEAFFSNILIKTGMAYIAIMHLDRDHISMMADIIKKYTPMLVFTIVNGVEIQPNSIYVIPPRKNVAIKGDALVLLEQVESHYRILPINHLFCSPANERAEDPAVCVHQNNSS